MVPGSRVFGSLGVPYLSLKLGKVFHKAEPHRMQNIY